jgi:[acyl-carrier-protein] S-malonyltransferase
MRESEPKLGVIAMKIGMIFPGQGSQFLGMGKDFYDSERIFQERFEQASKCLDQNFVRLCFASSDNELCKTINAQTAIFLVSASIFSVLRKKYGITPDLVAGHSSGEYSAIYAAGGITFPDALYLLKKRALCMEEATKSQNGGMLAVIGLSKDILQKICSQYDDGSSQNAVAQIVNFNSSKQLVISGTVPELERIKYEVQDYRGKAVMLKVAGAFHSRLMVDAEEKFEDYMLKVDFKDLFVPLANNTQAKLVCSCDHIRKGLKQQISSPVLWWQSLQHFADMDIILQIGPGDKLSKMLKKEWPDKKIFAVNKIEDMHDILTLLGKKIEISYEAVTVDKPKEQETNL